MYTIYTFVNEKFICNRTSDVPEKFGTFLRFPKWKLLHELYLIQSGHYKK